MTVRFDVSERVARVTIDRPERRNAVDPATLEALEATWKRIEGDPEIRCVVLTGAGERAFCAGWDVGEEKSGLDYWADQHEAGFGGISLRATLDVPVIARVNGYAFGGGLVMVLGCDIAIAAEHAEFGLTEPRLGYLPLDGGIQIARHIPLKWAMGVLLTGRRFGANDALAMGLLNEVVPKVELDEAVDRWVSDILACAPRAVRAIKQMVRETAHLSAADAAALKLPALVDALNSEDGKEGVRALREKRPPVWSGL